MREPKWIELGNGLDIIGDIHGCMDEWLLLLEKLGYKQSADGLYRHPEGRKILSLGDIMSRGPRSLDSLLFFEAHIQAELAYMIDSNHGWKIARWLDGRKVTLAHGDERVEEEFLDYERQHGSLATNRLKERIKNMLLDAPSHYVIQDNGASVAVAVHAGIRDDYIGKQSPKIADYCRYGPVVGVQRNGKPKRGDWTIHHHSPELIIWGHDPRPVALEVQRTINIDQGAVFGGDLTALRLPSKEIVQVESQDYAQAAINPLEEWFEKRRKAPAFKKWVNGFTVQTETGREIQVELTGVLEALDHFSNRALPLEQLVYLPTDDKHVSVLAFRDQGASHKWTGLSDLLIVADFQGCAVLSKGDEGESHKKRFFEQIEQSQDFMRLESDWLLYEGVMAGDNIQLKNLLASEHGVELTLKNEASTQQELAFEGIKRLIRLETVERIHECVLAAYLLK